MYKVLIVDDEKMIRNGIKAILPWEKLGIEQVFTAASANEAMAILEQEKPEIMLTDICMSEASGLELIEWVNKENSQLKIIVLTGYDNFEYVQKCCRMQVEDFFLKPADEDELVQAIRKIVRKLDQEKEDQKSRELMSRTIGMAEQLQLEAALRNLVHGNCKAEELSDLLEVYDCSIRQPAQIAVLVPMLQEEQRWQEHHTLLSLSVKNLCIERLDARREGITFEDHDGKLILVLFERKEFDEVMDRVEQLRNLLEDEYNAAPKIVVGSMAEQMDALSISYNDALYLLNHAQEDVNDIILSKHSERRLKMFHETLAELKHIMVSNLGNVERMLKAFDTFVRMTDSYNLSNSMVARTCFDIAAGLYFAYINEMGESADNKLNALLSSLLSCSREDSCKFTRALIEQMFDREKEETHDIVKTAKRYINEHLAEELSVSDIAAQLFITPNYFSRLFKKVTAEGCNEYIVRKRIEKAKCLLQTTTIKTGQIALMVGYRDTNYFSLAFKKESGMSPTAYRSEQKEGMLLS